MASKNDLKKVADSRANHAFKMAKLHTKGNYDSYVKKMPAMIMNNGLLNTLAFGLSKKNEWINIISDIRSWIGDDNCPVTDTIKECGKNGSDVNTFVENILKLSSDEYLLLTREVLNYLNWLRRFADAFSKNKEGSGE